MSALIHISYVPRTGGNVRAQCGYYQAIYRRRGLAMVNEHTVNPMLLAHAMLAAERAPTYPEVKP